MIEVYHAEPVANSVKVLICLFEKNVEFTSHYVNLLKFEQHEPEYLRINPDGIVPALVEDGKIVTESSIINEYLEERFPDPALTPADPYARARMRIWTKWLDDYFGPHMSRFGWHFLLHPLATKLGPEAMAERLNRIPMPDRRAKWATIAGSSFTPEQLEESRAYGEEGVKRLEALLGQGPWTAGADYSLSDIATYGVIPALPRLMPELVNEETTPGIMDWLRRMNARPAVQKALAMPNKVPETLQEAGL